MRVYTKIRLNLNTGNVIEQNYYEYNGPVAEAKSGGGSTTTTTIDYAYNARMAKIAEAQQKMSQEYFDFWKDEYKPMEEMQVEANKWLIPDMANLEKASYKQALRAMDPELIEREARMDVGMAFAESEDALRREMGRMGIDPTSGKGLSMLKQDSLDKSKALAYAMKDTLTLSKEGEGDKFEDLWAAKQAATGGGVPSSTTPETAPSTTPVTQSRLTGGFFAQGAPKRDEAFHQRTQYFYHPNRNMYGHGK